jgi:hypothetical protein
MSGIFHRNIALMLVSIVVIPIMVYLNAPSPSTKIGSIRQRPNSPRMGAVVEAEVYASAEVALLVEAMAMVVIEPKPTANGRVMMLRLRCLQRLPQIMALENKMADLAGGILLILGYHDKWVADPKSFSLPVAHLFGFNQGRLLLREAIVSL